MCILLSPLGVTLGALQMAFTSTIKNAMGTLSFLLRSNSFKEVKMIHGRRLVLLYDYPLSAMQPSWYQFSARIMAALGCFAKRQMGHRYQWSRLGEHLSAKNRVGKCWPKGRYIYWIHGYWRYILNSTARCSDNQHTFYRRCWRWP